MERFKINCLFILLLLEGISFCSKAQSSLFKKDTVYVVYCYGTLENGRPVENTLVCKDINFFKDLSQIENEDEFLCLFFKHSIVYTENITSSIFKHKTQYGFANKQQQISFETNQEQRASLLFQSNQEFISHKFSNHECLIIRIAKMIGEFWLDKIDSSYIYPVSESFKIHQECYSYGYLYDLKQIDKIEHLNQQDNEALTVLLKPSKKH